MLHKISSNIQQVSDTFTTEDLAPGLKDFNLVAGELPTQQSLGLCWDLERDTFIFNVSQHGKPYARRWIRSTISRLRPSWISRSNDYPRNNPASKDHDRKYRLGRTFAR